MTRCPDYAGRPGRSPRADPDRRVLAHQRMRRANSARHAASTAFAFTASRTGPRSLCRGEASRVPPGDVACVATLAGAASRPTFTTPRDDAPRWTGRITHSELNPKVNSPGLELGASQGQWKGHSRQGPSGTTLVPCSSRPTKLREVRQSSIQGASYPHTKKEAKFEVLEAP